MILVPSGQSVTLHNLTGGTKDDLGMSHSRMSLN
jgi:hypothetical protein